MADREEHPSAPKREAMTTAQGEIARAAIEQAERAGAKGRRDRRDGSPGLTPAQAQLRDTAIVLGSHAGITAAELAKRFQVTKRRVEQILADFRLRPTAIEALPREIVERSLRVYESQMANALMVATDTLERSPAVAIAAMKLHADLHERYTNLLADIGKLPDDLELFAAEMELVRLGDLMLAKLDELEAGETSASEVREFIRGALRSHAPLPLIEGRASDA